MRTVDDAFQQNLSTPRVMLPEGPWVLRVLSAVNVFEGPRNPHVAVRFQPLRPVNEEHMPEWDFSRIIINNDTFLNLDEISEFENSKEEDGVVLKHTGNKVYAGLLRAADVTGVSFAEGADELPTKEVVAYIQGSDRNRDGTKSRFVNYRIVSGGLQNDLTFMEVDPT